MTSIHDSRLSGSEAVLQNSGIVIVKFLQSNAQFHRDQSTDRRLRMISTFRVKGESYTFLDENGEEANPRTPVHIDPASPYGPNNIKFMHAYRDNLMSVTERQFLVIFDPHAEEKKSALEFDRQVEAQKKIKELRDSGNWTLLGNILRRKRGSIVGVTQDGMYSDLMNIAREDPEFIENIFSSQFDELLFVVDFAVERGLWQKTGSEQYTADGIKGVVAIGSLAACHYLTQHPDYLDALKRQLGIVPELSKDEINRQRLQLDAGDLLEAGAPNPEDLVDGDPSKQATELSEEDIKSLITAAVGRGLISNAAGWYQIQEVNHPKMRMDDLIKFVQKNTGLIERLK